MITLNEKELQEIHKSKGIIKIKKNTNPTIKPGSTNFMPALNIFFNRIFTVLSEIKGIANSLFSRMDKLEDKLKQPESKPAKPRPKQWNFKVVRDMEGRIKEVQATPKPEV
jgi:hypothetical protein